MSAVFLSEYAVTVLNTLRLLIQQTVAVLTQTVLFSQNSIHTTGTGLERPFQNTMSSSHIEAFKFTQKQQPVLTPSSINLFFHEGFPFKCVPGPNLLSSCFQCSSLYSIKLIAFTKMMSKYIHFKSLFYLWTAS